MLASRASAVLLLAAGAAAALLPSPDVELLPGVTLSAETALTTAATTEPPTDGPELPIGNGTSSDHINYEGLYYTVYAAKNTHQEIRTPLEALSTSSHSCGRVRAVPGSVRRQLALSTFYQRYTEAYGIPVLGSNRVSDAALRRACYIVRFLFADHKGVRDSYRQRRGRVAVIGRHERTTQIPEHSSLGPAWDRRARGLGATDNAPVCTIGEENLLNLGYPTDRWYTEDIGLHEFAHGLHLLGARYAWPAWESRLRAAYRSAMARGLWPNTYAATNYIEYFAEGVQKYHNVEAYSRYPNGIHNHVDTRAKLAKYDPQLYSIVQEMFPCGNRYISRRGGGFQAASDAAQLKLTYPACRLEGSGGQGPTGPDPAVTARPGPSTTARSARSCRDRHHYCPSWARSGYCYSNAAYMNISCRRSCGLCGSCRDMNGRCREWAGRGECAANPAYMLQYCRPSCRVC